MLLPAGISGESPDFTIDNSLRFRSSASAYLSRTPSSTGDRTEWTWSAWVKHSALGTNFGLFSVDSSAATNQYLSMLINSSDEFQIFEYTGAAYTLRLATNAVFRDPSAWYHLVCAVDTDQATSSDRVKLYVNGVQQTSLRLSDYPSSGLATYANVSGNLHAIGATVGATTTPDRYMDGYMTEINFIDGQQLAPIDFGETDEDTGVWKPKAYSGTYGTNGFYLDGSGVTDSSGNGNNWTNNNLNLTTSSATTYDLMTDVPTLTDENTANYATANPLDADSSISITDGNLKATASTATHNNARTTISCGSSGYFYSELTYGSTVGGSTAFAWGLYSPTFRIDNGTHPISASSGFYGLYASASSDMYTNGSTGSSVTVSTGSAGDILQLAYDVAGGNLWFGKNNVWYDSAGGTTGNPSTGANPTITSVETDRIFGFDIVSNTLYFNFGQRPFAYTPPTGFKALNTYNLPDSTIEDGGEYFNTVLYSGDGTNDRAITGVGFQPDFTWLKARNDVADHTLFDAVRGAGSNKALYSNGNYIEGAYTAGFDAFLSDGFQVDNNVYTNSSSNTYAAWNWKANGSGVSNSIGSIPSTVSANTTSGVSIVTYTGNATAGATVGHGLGTAPKMVFCKKRNSATSSNWMVLHSSLGAGYALNLNGTSAAGSIYWNNTLPTSTVFTLDANSNYNSSADSFIAYCFAPVEGFSAFGSYTGNGSADGPFVYTGFSPSWLLIKRSDAAANWLLYDNKRVGYNVNGYYLLPDLNNAEGAGTDNRFDLISNGFKVRDSNQSLNVSGGTYIYAAFAENPFKNALAR